MAIAPSTYYAAKKRPPPARTVRDAWLTAEITCRAPSQDLPEMTSAGDRSP